MERGINRLIIKTGEGDVSALEALYRELGNGVYCYALSVLSDKSAAEDVLQDTFVRVFTMARTYTPGRNGRAWVYAIARNLCLDRLRAAKRTATQPGTEEDAEQDVAAMDFIGDVELRDALAKLDGDLRQIVLLHLAAGLKFREIAALHGEKQSKIEWAYYSAVRQLSSYYRV